MYEQINILLNKSMFMTQGIGDLSDDGYWVLTESGWEATDKQKQALEEGAVPYQSGDSQVANSTENIQIVTIPTDKSGQFSDRSVWIWRIAAGAVCFIGIVVFLILILGPSAEEKELIGTWENDVDGLEFKDNGDLTTKVVLMTDGQLVVVRLPSQILMTQIMNGDTNIRLQGKQCSSMDWMKTAM